jgi:hypothetical protein
MALRKINKYQYTLTTAGANFLTATLASDSFSGYLTKIKVKSPAAVDNSATLATTLKDNDGDSIAIAAGFATQAVNSLVQQIADLQTQPNQLKYPVNGALTLTVTLSANQTVGRAVIVTLYVDQLVN